MKLCYSQLKVNDFSLYLESNWSLFPGPIKCLRNLAHFPDSSLMITIALGNFQNIHTNFSLFQSLHIYHSLFSPAAWHFWPIPSCRSQDEYHPFWGVSLLLFCITESHNTFTALEYFILYLSFCFIIWFPMQIYFHCEEYPVCPAH